MADPPRLRSESGTLSALLLRSAPNFEPPPSAEDEVWRRIQVVTAVSAAAGASGLAAHAVASAGTKIVGNALWVGLLKWGMIVAVGLPAIGIATRWALHGKSPISAAPAPTAESPPKVTSSDHTARSLPTLEPSPALVSRERAMPDAPKRPAVPFVAHDSSSALKAESLLLGVARSKFAAGDTRGALEDVTQLGVQFPHGSLVQEREVVAIDCLATLDDRRAMRARAVSFLERFPSSPYAAHLRQLLAQ
jgi:hypothetical protein